MPDIFLPPGVRYACLRCGLCCRSLEVTLTEVERQRLLAAGALPVTEGLFARIRRARGKQVWRLRPKADGACPFLAPDNLCRIHAELGHAAKPFAGRVFPFQFVLTPIGVFVGCRFSCPAVARGEGAELEGQRADIRRLYGEYARTYNPPVENEPVRFFAHYKLSWRDILRMEDQIIAFLLIADLELPRRLLACLRLVRQFVAATAGSKVNSRVGIEPDAILAGVKGKLSVGGLSATERLFVRLGVAAFTGATPHYYRELPFAQRLGVRLGNLWRRVKMAAGFGCIRLPGLAGTVRVRDVQSVELTALDPESADMLQRYLVAKVASQQFFGRACFGRSFAQGFEWLVMAYAAILWLAAAHAVASGRRKLQPSDVEFGIRQVDHAYNLHRELGGAAARMRAALLWHWRTAEKLLAGLIAQG